MHVNKLRAVYILVLYFLHCIQGSMKSTCEAPPVEQGNEGVISCKFEENVLLLKSFSLDFIPVNGSEVDLVTLVSCIGTDKSLTCKNNHDFQFGKPINSIINVTITKCDAKYTGRYMCTVMESEPGDNKPCDLVVKGLPARQRDWDDTSWPNTTYSNDKTEKTDNTSKLDMPPASIAGIAVPLVVVSVIMVLAALLLSKRNRSKLKKLWGVKPFLPTTSSATPPPNTAVSNDPGGDSKVSLIRA